MTALSIIQKVSAARGVSISRLRGPFKSKLLCRIRHEVMWLLNKLLGMSFPETARALWRKNHTTALSGVRKISRAILDRPDYELELRGLLA